MTRSDLGSGERQARKTVAGSNPVSGGLVRINEYMFVIYICGCGRDTGGPAVRGTSTAVVGVVQVKIGLTHKLERRPGFKQLNT